MKGDFSRFTFDPRKNYTSVLMQQGRAQLDADWNEQSTSPDSTAHLDPRPRRSARRAPADGDGGFKIAVAADRECSSVPGRYYVDGLMW